MLLRECLHILIFQESHIHVSESSYIQQFPCECVAPRTVGTLSCECVAFDTVGHCPGSTEYLLGIVQVERENLRLLLLFFFG